MNKGQIVPILIEDGWIVDPKTNQSISSPLVKWVWVDDKYANYIREIPGVSSFVMNLKGCYQLLIDKRYDIEYVISEIESLVILKDEEILENNDDFLNTLNSESFDIWD